MEKVYKKNYNNRIKMTDPQFIEDIKLWVTYDNKIEEANKNIKNLRNEKTNVSNKITSYMESNNIQDTIINTDHPLMK